MKEDARSVDAFVRLTVRHVLFPCLRKPSRPRRAKVDAAVRQAGPLPFVVGCHHAHVLSYANWSDAQLQDERRRLKVFLKRKRKPLERPEHDEAPKTDAADEIVALEAFALLDLFLSEREHAAQVAPSRRLLRHAQLALFAQYHEKCHGREVKQNWSTSFLWFYPSA
jgi:hypothetical protein